jgi:hypothetical protein
LRLFQIAAAPLKKPLSTSAPFLVRTFALIAATLAANFFLSLGPLLRTAEQILNSLPTEAATLHQTLTDQKPALTIGPTSC